MTSCSNRDIVQDMKLLFLGFFVVFLFSCKVSEESISIFSQNQLITARAGEALEVSLVIKNDMFWQSALVEGVKIRGRYFDFFLPLTLVVEEEKSLNFRIPPFLYMIYKPYAYLGGEGKQIREVGENLAVPETRTIGTGDGVLKSFTGSAENCLPGTVLISSTAQGKSLSLSETSIGYLEGNGQGYVQNSTAIITFSDPPDEGVSVLLRCLKVINKKIKGNASYISYGDKKFIIENGLITENGTPVGEIRGDGSYVFYSAIGFRSYPLVVVYALSYYGSGEAVGRGNGSRTYEVILPYRGIDPQSLITFARNGNGEELWGQVISYDPAENKVTLEFPEPVDSSFTLYVSFRLLYVIDVFDIYLLADGKEYYGGSISVIIYSSGGEEI